MPSIRDAMVASLARSVVERDIFSSAANGVSSVKTTLSSWDNCMAATYCKWPVIGAIIAVGLIVLSVVWCVIRCACCGLSCCCSCFSCLKCCGDCCGCCDDPRGKKHKHLDEDSFKPGGPNSHAGYSAPGPMPVMGGGLTGYMAAPEPPKYAQFEVGPNGHAVVRAPINDDALPPMPSWDTAQKKRITNPEGKDSVELGELDPRTGQQVPLMSGAAAAGSMSRSASPMGFGAGMGEMPSPSPYADQKVQGHDYLSSGASGAAAMGAWGQQSQAVDQYGRPLNQNSPYSNTRGPQSQAGTPRNQYAQPASSHNQYDDYFDQDQQPQNPYGNNQQAYGAASPAPSYARPYGGPPPNGMPAQIERSFSGDLSQRSTYGQSPAVAATPPPGYASPRGPAGYAQPVQPMQAMFSGGGGSASGSAVGGYQAYGVGGGAQGNGLRQGQRW